MPTTTSIAHELWTPDEFLDWLEPGVLADLIDGEILTHTREQESLFQETHIPVAPAWVAEILSAATALNDVGRKFAKYEEYGVEEYWVLDPKTLAHRFYSRRDSLLLEFGQNEEIIRSRTIPGFWVRRVWLDRRLPANPTVAEALAQLVARDE